MKANHKHKNLVSMCILLLSAGLLITGCNGNGDGGLFGMGRGGTGAAVGGGLGALAGQAIGGDTKSTLIGAGIGAGAGYLIGSRTGGDDGEDGAVEEYDYTTPTVLTGTKWEVEDLDMDNPPDYERMTIEFTESGKMVTRTYKRDGTVDVDSENYRIIGDKLVVNKPGYVVNFDYELDGDDLELKAENWEAELDRIDSF